MPSGGRKLSREAMIDLVIRIILAEGTDKEISANVALFDANCLHPAKNSLIFWPHGSPHDPSKPGPTPEEIVEKAMSGANMIRL